MLTKIWLIYTWKILRSSSTKVHIMMLLISNTNTIVTYRDCYGCSCFTKKSNHTFFSWMDVVFVTNVAQQKYPRVPYMDSIDFLTTKRIDGTWVMFVILDVLNVIHYSLSLCTYTIISFSISCYNIFVVLDVIQICYKHANI